MSTFHYRGYDASGKALDGHIEAASPKEARETLAARGILAHAVEGAEAAAAPRRPDRAARLTRTDRGLLYRELGALVRAGFPLAAALDMMLESADNHRFARHLAPVRDGVREGLSAAEAMAGAWPSATAFERAVLEAGERSADLPRVLEELAAELEAQERIRRHIAGACAYPLFLIGLALVIAFGVFGFMLPRFGAMFEEAGLELPWITRFFLGVGRWMPHLLALGFATAAGAAWLVRRYWTGSGRAGIERGLMAVRPVRWLVEPVIAQRFAGTLSMLLRSGVSPVDGVRMAGAATGFASTAQAAARASEALQQGASVAQALHTLASVQRHIGTWVRAGDAGGDLAGMLAQAAGRCREVVQRRFDQTLRWIEPGMILLVGLLILGVALAILLPILALNQSIGAAG